MNSQNIIIYEFEELFSILEEIKEILKFNLILVKITDKDHVIGRVIQVDIIL